MADKIDTDKQEQPQARGTLSFAAFLAKARKLDGSGSPVRSTAHTSSVFVPADIEPDDKTK